jgi:hypothetical protein
MKKLLRKLLDGVIMGMGFLIFCIVVGAVCFYLFADFNTKRSFVEKLQDKGLVEEVVQSPDQVATTVKRIYLEPPLPTPEDYEEIWVNDSKGLIKAVRQANKNGSTAIVLESGTYLINSIFYINADDITIKSVTGNPYDVILKGTGMERTGGVGGIFRVNADYFTLDGVTLTDVPNHLVQVAGEINASYPRFRNVIFQDAYEQLLKVSYNFKNQEAQNNKSIGGIIEGCIFQYTKGIGPNFYIGGVDALGAENWIVKNSIFRDIASPKGRIAQYAVHFWDNSDNNQVIDNIFIDNDRAIGFGMRLPDRGIRYAHKNGVAKSNIIYHTDNGDPFADVGIMAEGNHGLLVEDNFVLQLHAYSNAIEYRWDNSNGIKITNNTVNKRIVSRDEAQAVLEGNSESLTLEQFLIELQEKSDLLSVVDFKYPVERLNIK